MKTIETFVKAVVSTGPGTPLTAVARLMEERNVGAVVVVENHKPVGIITDRDLALQMGARCVPPATPVGKVMSTPVKVAALDQGIFDTTQDMKDLGVRRLPVVDGDGRLAGLVTLDDLLRVLSRELSNLIEGIQPEMEVRP